MVCPYGKLLLPHLSCNLQPATPDGMEGVTIGISGQEGRASSMMLTLSGGGAPGGPSWAWHGSAVAAGHGQQRCQGLSMLSLNRLLVGASMHRAKYVPN